jgi:hypothetical protein
MNDPKTTMDLIEEIDAKIAAAEKENEELMEKIQETHAVRADEKGDDC